MSHSCDLPNVIRAEQRKLLPNVNWKKRIHLKLIDLFTVWDKHVLTKLYYVSKHSINDERRRHATRKRWYIVHPLSKVNYYKDLFYFFVWIWSFYKGAYVVAQADEKLLDVNSSNKFIRLSTTPLLLFYCLTNFFVGYIDKRTGETILEPLPIAKRYLSTYCMFDFIGSIPVYSIYLKLFRSNLIDFKPNLFDHFIKWFPMIILARMITVSEQLHHYALRATNDLAISAGTLLIFIVTYVIYLNSCLLYYIIHHSNHVWASIKHHDDQMSVADLLHRFFFYVFVSESLFYGTESSDAAIDVKISPCLIFALWSLISGYLAQLITMAWMLCATTTMSATTNSYDLFVDGVRNYVTDKHLRTRALSYCSKMFNGKYYDEKAVTRTFYDHINRHLLRRECLRMGRTYPLFNHLPIEAIETIYQSSTIEYYLEGDVISVGGDTLSDGLIVMCGALALYYPKSGIECPYHFQDTDVVGLISTVSGFKALLTYVAVEFTKLLRIPLVILLEQCEKYPDFKRSFDRSIEERLAFFRNKYRYLQMHTGQGSIVEIMKKRRAKL